MVGIKGKKLNSYLNKNIFQNLLFKKMLESKAGNILKYSSCVYLTQILNILSIFLIPKFLTPELLGKFNLLQVIYGYMDYSHLGIRFGLDKEIPTCLAKKQLNKARYVANVGIIGILLITCLIDLVIFISLFFFSHVDKYLFWGTVLTFISATVATFFNSQRIILRAHEDISKMSQATIIYGVIWNALRLLGVIMYGFYGLLFGIFISNILIVLVIAKIYPYKLAFKVNPKLMINLFMQGLPFFGNGFVAIIFRSLDKWVILKILGFTELGYYSIASMILNFLFVLPSAINEVLFPGLLRKIAINDNKDNIASYLKRYMLISSKLFVMVIGSIVIFIPLFITYFIPKYIVSINVAQISILASYPAIFQGLFVYYLYGKNKHKSLILPNLFTIIFFLACVWILKTFNMINLINISILMVISNFLIAYITIFLSFLELNIKVENILMIIGKTILYLGYVAIAFLLVMKHISPDLSLLANFSKTLINEFIFLLFSLPLVISIKKQLSNNKA